MKRMLISATMTLLISLGTANAVDPPQQKEGLWSIHMQSTDNPGSKKTDSSSTICRNHAYDDHVRSVAKNIKGCTTVNENYQGGKYSVEMHCVQSGTVVDTKGTVTYQGDLAAHSENHATYTPAMGGVSDTTMIMDQKYLGSCPAGAQPALLRDWGGAGRRAGGVRVRRSVDAGAPTARRAGEDSPHFGERRDPAQGRCLRGR